MEENLRTARTTHQVLMGICGIYLLGSLAFDSEGLLISEFTFWGIKTSNVYAFKTIMAAAFLLTTFRLVAYLQHIRLLPKDRNDYHTLDDFPWLLLCKQTRLTLLLNVVEVMVFLGVGGDIGNGLYEMRTVTGIVFYIFFLGLFIYGLKQVTGIQEDLQIQEQMEHYE